MEPTIAGLLCTNPVDISTDDHLLAGAWPKNVVTRPNLKAGLCGICYPPERIFLRNVNLYAKI